MQPFKQLLASIGVGAAKIDTQLETLEVRLGDTLKGQLVITGGAVTQEIDNIYIHVKTKYKKQGLDTAYYANGTVCHFQVTEAFSINAEETKIIPFEISLPLYTPITDGLSVLWLKTELEIHHALDQDDEDYLTVTPLPIMQSLLNNIEAIGFEKQEVGNEDGSLEGMLPFDTGFYQVFRFTPTQAPFVDKIEHVNVVLNPLTVDEIEVLFDVYHKPHNLLETVKEEFGFDLQKLKLNITQEQAPTLKELLMEQLSSLLN